MSLYLLLILFIILAVDFLVALSTTNSVRTEGKEKNVRMLQRYGIIFGGYAAVALIAYMCSQAYPNMEYISGLLLDPIFRYSVSLLDRLKILMTRPKKEEKNEKPEKPEKPEKVEEVKVQPQPAKAVPAKKPEPVMIEIEPAKTTKTEKPKAKPRARKTTKA